MDDNPRAEINTNEHMSIGDGALWVFTMNIWNFSDDYPARQRLLRAGIARLHPDHYAVYAEIEVGP